MRLFSFVAGGRWMVHTGNHVPCQHAQKGPGINTMTEYAGWPVQRTQNRVDNKGRLVFSSHAVAAVVAAAAAAAAKCSEAKCSMPSAFLTSRLDRVYLDLGRPGHS